MAGMKCSLHHRKVFSGDYLREPYVRGCEALAAGFLVFPEGCSRVGQ